MIRGLVPSGHPTGLSVPAYHRRDTLSNFYPLVALKCLHVQSVGTDAQSLVAPKCHSLLVNERSCMLCLNLHRALLRNTHMSIIVCLSCMVGDACFGRYREAARECRRKKKEYIKCLENRVALLENQNKTLIEELKSLKELYCQKEQS